MRIPDRFRTGSVLRTFIQWGFLVWTLYVGITFALFVRSYQVGTGSPLLRHPSVEAFLPVGILVSIRYWVQTGILSRVHPAGVVLLLTFVGMSFLARCSFCSFVCPVGTLSDAAGRLGKKITGWSLRPWKWADLLLRTGKYLLLLFFLRLVLGMPLRGIGGFLQSRYWAVADVKMLHFFTNISVVTLLVLLALTVLSLLIRNFWCRYLCPYGALIGLAGLLSPWKARRNRETCSDCGACARACPAWLPVDRKAVVRSVECTGCLECVDACPRPGALTLGLPFWKRPLSWWVYPAFVVLLFALGVGAGMATGTWHGSVTDADYRMLIPVVEKLGF